MTYFNQAPPINVIEPVSPYACHALLLIIDQETVSTNSKTTLNETTGNYDGLTTRKNMSGQRAAHVTNG